MNREIEIKFKIEEPRVIRKKFKEIGAKKLSRVLERNIIFDTKKGNLEKKGQLLRLRKDYKCWITFKGKRVPGQFKDREEFNLEIADLEKMQKVLERLEFYPKEVYEKIRETYQWQNVRIFIDKFYFGWWLEIEGTKRGIRKTIKALDFNISQGSNKNYMELYRDWCRKNKIKPRKKILL